METNLNNKPWVWQTIGYLVIIFLALAVLDKIHVVSENYKNGTPKNTISMSSEGKVSATPDLATVNVGVLVNATTAKAAQQDMTGKANQIIDFVKKLGIDSSDITTANFSVYPNYNYTNGKNEINGYQANQTVAIKVHGVDKSTDVLGKVLDGAVSNGSNQVQGITFSFNDPDNLKQQARLQAIDKAKQKAQDLAQATGLKLGKITNISEGSYSSPSPMPYAMGMGGGAADAKSVPSSIEAGSQDVTANITVTFELK